VNGDNGAVRIPWTLLVLLAAIIGNAIMIYGKFAAMIEKQAELEKQLAATQLQFSAEHGAILNELSELQKFEAGEIAHGKAQDERLDTIERRR
jgi:hypothetical protein